MRFSVALTITTLLVMAAPTFAVSNHCISGYTINHTLTLSRTSMLTGGMFSYEVVASPHANYLQPIAIDRRDGIVRPLF